MSLAWLVIGVTLLVVGLAGLLLPLLPGMPLVFLGAVAIAAADGFTRVGYLSLAVIAVLVGLPFGLPGLVFGPALGAAALEFARDQELRRAARASTGVLIGFVLGTVVKYAIACMILGILLLAYMF